MGVLAPPQDSEEVESRSRRDGAGVEGLRETFLQITQAPAYASCKVTTGATDAKVWVEQARNLPKLLTMLPLVFKESKAFVKAEDSSLV